MKKFRIPLIMMMIVTFGFMQKSNAQKKSNGLYLTYTDYLNHKLSYSADNRAGSKIIIHEFIGQKDVTVIDGGKKQNIAKSELFGYRVNNNDYRFYNDKAYQIVDTTGFYIYSYDKLIQQGKGPKPTRIYYFSKKTDTEILRLTPENIAKAFPKNQMFKYMVEVEAKSDIKLDAYDTQSDEYKIKELYSASLKQ